MTKIAAAARTTEPVRAWPWSHVLVASLIFLALSTFRRREIWELFTDSGFDSEVKFKILVWIFLGFLVLCATRSVVQNSHLLFRTPLVFYFIFFLLASISTIYSGTPELTLFRAGQLGIVIALGIAAADRIERWPTLAMLYLAGNWVLLLIGLFGYPPSLHWRQLPAYQEPEFALEGAMWRFGTPMGHFSMIGIIAAMVALALVARLHRRPSIGELVVLAWLILTVLLTVSRTAIAGLVLGLLVVLAARRLLAFSTLVVITIAATLVTLPSVVPNVTAFLERGQSQEDLMSLTNRTNIYESALGLLRDNWVLGLGYRSRAIVLDQQIDGSGVTHAHNAVLDAALGLGIGGALTTVLILMAFPLCALGLRFGRSVMRSPAVRDRGIEFMALFLPLLTFSILDSSFALEVNPFTVFLVAILVDLARCRTLPSAWSEASPPADDAISAPSVWTGWTQTR